MPDAELGAVLLRAIRSVPPPLKVDVLARWCRLTPGAFRGRWRRRGLSPWLGTPKTFLANVVGRYACERIRAGANPILIGVELQCDERTVRRLTRRILPAADSAAGGLAPQAAALPLGSYLSAAGILGYALCSVLAPEHALRAMSTSAAVSGGGPATQPADAPSTWPCCGAAVPD